MNTENDRHFDELIGDILEKNLPADVDRRLRWQLESFRCQLIEMDKSGVHRPMTLGRTKRRAVLCLAGVAAALLVGLAVGLLGSAPTWAQVVAAVRAKPWVHATVKTTTGKTAEFWLSAEREVAASRDDDRICFDNYPEKSRYTYDTRKKTLVREPESRVDREQWQSMLNLFDAVFHGDATLSNPLPGTQLVGQKHRTLTEAGRSWTDYQLDLTADSAGVRLTFRVDPRTRLPKSMAFVSTPHSDAPKMASIEAEFVFDYPEQGPADIYALGVPRSARVDDRVPHGELARLLDGINNSRDKFPQTYLAAVSRGNAKALPQFIWRKGEKWRREYRFPRTPEDRAAFKRLSPPPAGPQAAVWWKETTKNWRAMPMEICDGAAIYAQVGKTEKDEWKKIENGASLRLISNYLPERAGYPLPPGSAWSCSIDLDMHPSSGPPGTVLLTSRPAADAATHVRLSRFWVDPAKSFLGVRQEYSDVDPKAGPNRGIDTYSVDGIAQAPNGVWYPTVIHWKSTTGTGSKEESSEQTWTYSIDFTTDIPDALFRIEGNK
jgi:hypothetical protein